MAATSSSTEINKNKSRNQNYDLDWLKHTNANQFLTEERRLINNLKSSSVDRGSQKKMSRYNGEINRMTYEQVLHELNRKNLSITGELDLLKRRLKHHYKAELLNNDHLGRSPLETYQQRYEYLAVIDFEATCDENQPENYQHEIIEFPIVLIHVQTVTITDTFRSFCRPVLKPILSDYCQKLTGITQEQVDAAPEFPETLKNVGNWLNDRNLLSSKRKCAFVTDGPWDMAKFLRLQCYLSNIEYPHWAKKWINVRKAFGSFYSTKRCGILAMLSKLGLNFDGHRHSGLDDSINIAKITMELIKDGCVLIVNEFHRPTDVRSDPVDSSQNCLFDTNGDDFDPQQQEEDDKIIQFISEEDDKTLHFISEEQESEKESIQHLGKLLPVTKEQSQRKLSYHLGDLLKT
ncbi:unnamed protein product, partial [Didymodactylos carnosus]